MDLTLVYWTASLPLGDALAPYPAIRRCAELVMDRPKLRGMFDQLAGWSDEYARLQATGKGLG